MRPFDRRYFLPALFCIGLSGCRSEPTGTGETDEISILQPLPASQSAFKGDREWQLLGGLGVRGSWDAIDRKAVQVRSLAIFKTDMYVGLGDSEQAPDLGQVWRFDGQRWSLIGGSGVNGSWSSKRSVGALVSDGSYLYAGLGSNAGDAEVWRYDGVKWEEIGGDGSADGWDDTHDYVWTMAFFRSELYVGMFTERLGEQRPALYKFDGTRWHYLVGDENPPDPTRGGWARNDGVIMVYRLFPDEATNTLFIGLAGRAQTPDGGPRDDPAEVWTYDGSVFRKIGGDGVNSSWPYSRSYYLEDVTRFGNEIVASLQRYWPEAEHPLWKWNGSSWTPFSASYPVEWQTIQNFNGMIVYNGRLYVGAGLPTGERASVWELQPNQQWRRVGGRGEFGSAWHVGTSDQATQWIYPLAWYRGHLVIGLATAETPGGAQVWIY